MAQPEHIKLEWYELQVAAACGASRQIESFRLSAQPKLNYWSWHSHIEGAAAELAVAKYLNCHFPASVNTFKGADLGKNIQVRAREPNAKYPPQLIIRPTDQDDEVFVLVVGASPNWEIIGGIVGRDGKRPEWIKDPGNKGPAYFVPKHYLKPLSQLPLEF